MKTRHEAQLMAVEVHQKAKDAILKEYQQYVETMNELLKMHPGCVYFSDAIIKYEHVTEDSPDGAQTIGVFITDFKMSIVLK